MTLEAELLLACAREAVRPGSADVRKAAGAGVDWDSVIQLAGDHAVLPLVCWTARDSGPDRLRAAFMEMARENLTRAGRLLALLDLFQSHGIRTIPLKGPTLASILYGNLAMRSFSDLDFLVRRSDAIRAADLLLANRFQMHSTIHWPAKAAYLRAKEGELSFATEEDVRVDLHWELLPRYFSRTVDFDQLWNNLQPVSIGGQAVRSLSDEHLLLFLCGHGAKHLWERLGWICDVARLVEVRPELDWTYLLAAAEATRTTNMLCVGLRLASELLGARVPNLPKHDARLVEQAVRAATARLFTGSNPALATESFRVNLPLIETATQKLRYTAGMILMPTEVEFRLLQLPPWLFPLYYPYRAARLLGKYLGRPP